MNRDERLRRERAARAVSTLREPPAPRSHAERMAAARGLRLHGDGGLTATPAQRRRTLEHRKGTDGTP